MRNAEQKGVILSRVHISLVSIFIITNHSIDERGNRIIANDKEVSNMGLYNILDAALALYESGTTAGMTETSKQAAIQLNDLLNKYHISHKEMFVTELMDLAEQFMPEEDD